MRHLRPLIFLALGPLLLLTGAAYAQVTEIYKCVDSGGRPLYTSDKKDTTGKKCEVVSREVNVAPTQKAPPLPRTVRRGRGEDFPTESPSARNSAKERQREILETELATEQGLLAEARRLLAEQEATRGSDESTTGRGGVQRLKPYKEAVELHEQNVETLKRELGNPSR